MGMHRNMASFINTACLNKDSRTFFWGGRNPAVMGEPTDLLYVLFQSKSYAKQISDLFCTCMPPKDESQGCWNYLRSK